jgi:KDO2-lipid IV(A) lauroyltransferase
VELVVRRLPWAGQLAVGAQLGNLWRKLDRKHRGVAAANVERAFPEWTPEQKAGLVAECFRHVGRSLAELLGLSSLSREGLLARVSWEGTENLDQALSLGRGVFILIGHLGNWELMVPAISAKGVPLSAIYRRLTNPLVDAVVLRIRGRYGARMIPHRNALRPVLRWLQDNGAVLLAMDQRPLPQEAIPSRFFGHPVATNPSLALMALRTDAPVVPALSRRTPTGHVIQFQPQLPPPEEGSREARVHAYTLQFDAAVERGVRACPEQWFWVHDRWKIPPGMTL